MTLTIEEYQALREEYAGYCTHCNAITQPDGVEPDAHGYQCEECDGLNVMGIEEAMFCGHLEIA